MAPDQTATDHAHEIAVDLRRRNAGRDLEILQARRPRTSQQRLQDGAGDLDGIDALTSGLIGHLKNSCWNRCAQTWTGSEANSGITLAVNIDSECTDSSCVRSPNANRVST